MNIEILKLRRRAFYNSIVSIYCPALGDTVFFTSNGFNHLLYKKNRRPRTIDEQYLKLMCLPHAPRVIRESKEFKARNTTKEIKGKKKSVIQYGLVSEIAKDTEMRVVLEKIGTGKVEFVSVMPNNKRSRNKKRPRGRS